MTAAWSVVSVGGVTTDGPGATSPGDVAAGSSTVEAEASWGAAVSVTGPRYPPLVELSEARAILGVTVEDGRRHVRAAYLSRLRDAHPDRNDAAGAHERTVRLGDAYRTALAGLGVSDPPSIGGSDPGTATTTPAATVVPVAMLSDDTVGVGAPPDEVWGLLLEASHRLGEIAFIDPGAGLLQVVIEFLEDPVCQLVLSLQGRATGVTEVFCTVESLETGPPPPIAAVTRLLVDTLTA